MESLICLGSLNAHIEDRKLERNQIKPFQCVVADIAHECKAFSMLGSLGIASMAWVNGKVFFSTGDDLFYIDSKGGFVQIEIDHLSDVHEMTEIRGMLWIANTGTNELICIDPDRCVVVERVDLCENSSYVSGGDTTVDAFHCDQCFEDYHGKLCAVVHHVDGKQHYVKSLARKIGARLKQQGNGGVICPRSGRVYLKGLKAPHSVRLLGDGTYIICDSGRFELCQYDENWNLMRKISTRGWGRGVAVSESHIYVGVSATRKRYINLMAYLGEIPNMILAVNMENFEVEESLVVEDVEQVNNLYLIEPDISDILGIGGLFSQSTP